MDEARHGFRDLRSYQAPPDRATLLDTLDTRDKIAARARELSVQLSWRAAGPA